MKSVASLPQDKIDILIKLLEKAQIPYQSKLTDEEAGLGLVELLVRDDKYDEACEIIEKCERAQSEQEKAKYIGSCPECSAQSWERVDDADYADVGIKVFRCRMCGNLVS